MFRAEPHPTQADLNFSLLGVPVRVHPLFWLITLIMGASSATPPGELVIWMAVVFVSILVHEFGHALAFRFYGIGARIVLYSFGGLAIPEGNLRGFRSASWGHWARIAVAFAGPAAGFLFAALVIAGIAGSGHLIEFGFDGTLLPVQWKPFSAQQLNTAVDDLLFVNIFWGVINLFPVYPLDGGQIGREFLMMSNPTDGERQSLVLSLFTGVAVALFAAIKLRSFYMAILFGYLAYNSYMALQAYSGWDRRW